MKKQYILVSCFFLILAAGCIGYFICPDKKFSEEENRYLANKPEWSVENLFSGEFTSGLDSYATDQFALRNQAILVKTLTQKLAFVKDSNGVYFGKDNILMLKKTEEEFEEKRFKNNLSAIDSFAKLHEDVKISVLLAPTASAIWKDKLPLGAVDYNQEEKLKQAKEYLLENKNITFIDTYQTLSDHKNEELYYKTDHHWTTLGAYYGYEAFCNSNALEPQKWQKNVVTKDFYGTLYSKVQALNISPDEIVAIPEESLGDYTVSHENGKRVEETVYDKDKLEVKDKYQYFLGGNDGEVSIETNVKNGKHLLVIKDSYANCFVPFLLKEYESIHLVDLRYFNENMSMYIKSKDVNEVLVLYNLNNFDEDTSIIKLQMP